MRKLLLVAFIAALVGATCQAQTPKVQGIRYTVSAQTCASNGGATAAALTVTVLNAYVALTQSDPDGCALTLSETGALDGTTLTIANVSANIATIADSSGVQETTGGATITLAQHETASFLYRSDRWVELSRPRSSIAASVSLYAARVSLTDAQIKALPTTGITIVSAPGSAKQIVPFWATLYAKTTSGAYTNINAAAELSLRFAATAQGLAYVVNDAAITNGTVGTTAITSLIGTTTDKKAVLPLFTNTENLDEWGPIPTIETTANSTNVALTIAINNQGSGNLTGGNAANTLTVFVVYAVVDVP